MTATPQPNLTNRSAAPAETTAYDASLPEWLDALGRWTHGPLAVLAADLVSHRFSYVGGNIKGLLGYDRERFDRDGLPFYASLNHPDDESALAHLWSDLMSHTSRLRPDQRTSLQWTFSRRMRHADGSYRTLLVHQKPLAWDNQSGALVSNVGILTDITPIQESSRPVGWLRYVEGPGRWTQVDLARQSQNEVNLTLREKEVLRHVAQGYTSHDIATRLFISKETVDTHRKRILAKAQVKNTAELVRLATRLGLV